MKEGGYKERKSKRKKERRKKGRREGGKEGRTDRTGGRGGGRKAGGRNGTSVHFLRSQGRKEGRQFNQESKEVGCVSGWWGKW
jgi:hypothetical protein